MIDSMLCKSNKLFNLSSRRFAKLSQVISFLFFILSPLTFLKAQDPSADGAGQGFIEANMGAIILIFIILVFVILVFGIIVISDRLINMTSKEVAEAKNIPFEEVENKFTLYPKLLPDQDENKRKVIKLKAGHDIVIKGKAQTKVDAGFESNTFGIKPDDFQGMSPIPKIMVEEGSEVKAGDPLFFDKKRPDIIYTAPVSGELIEVRRGEKRKIEELVLLGDKEMKFKDFGKSNPNELSREEVTSKMVESGIWPLLKRRPFSVVPEPGDVPKMIYISCFNSAPLAADEDFVVDGYADEFQAGIDALNKLTDGDVNLGLNARKKHSDVFLKANNVKQHWFAGSHPMGNAGIQIHHVSPINKGEQVWVMRPQDVIILGRLFTEGRYNTLKKVAVAGSEIQDPKYVETYTGANIENMIANNLIRDHVRCISGNVLTGKKIDQKGHLGFFDNLVSVIYEGDQYELFGWLLPSYPRPTLSPTFMSYLFSGEELVVNTNTHGEERPFVVTGLYEQLLPMDIYPMQLLKAIIVNDFEKMEGLGIYEVEEEDFALIEFADPSKIEMQEIIRDGLNLAMAEG
jgi:Na+-transporting NADH:ubiquinone oxidoreductase subunit A